MTTTVQGLIDEHLRALAELYRLLDNRKPTDEQLRAHELRTATLAASGLSNREIAARLYLSEDGVKGHLRIVFRKLRIARRAQLAGALAGLDGAA